MYIIERGRVIMSRYAIAPPHRSESPPLAFPPHPLVV
jgi:hypothetical protein